MSNKTYNTLKKEISNMNAPADERIRIIHLVQKLEKERRDLAQQLVIEKSATLWERIKGVFK